MAMEYTHASGDFSLLWFLIVAVFASLSFFVFRSYPRITSFLQQLFPPNSCFDPFLFTMKFTALILGAAAAVAAADGPVSLNADNFDATIEGKNALVKFLAPW